MRVILSVKNVNIYIQERDKVTWKKVVDNLNYQVMEGETVGIVGESGSGKSISVLAILNLLKKKNIRVEGSIVYNGHEMLNLSEDELQIIRGNEITMIFQDPLNCLNPMLKIKTQMVDILRSHKKISKKEAVYTAIKFLKMVGIVMPEKRINSYPFELSGGMIQRVVIAMAIMCSPKLIIADEPTTALDTTTQQQIIALLKEICEKNSISMIFISHNLDVVSEICGRVMVMYQGQKVEELPVSELYFRDRHLHPYTKCLLESVPKFNLLETDYFDYADYKCNRKKEFLNKGCIYAQRCSLCDDICFVDEPREVLVSKDHIIKCLLTSKCVE